MERAHTRSPWLLIAMFVVLASAAVIWAASSLAAGSAATGSSGGGQADAGFVLSSTAAIADGDCPEKGTNGGERGGGDATDDSGAGAAGAAT
jgi:hypothetical protein